MEERINMEIRAMKIHEYIMGIKRYRETFWMSNLHTIFTLAGQVRKE